jgi:molybdate transport system permease protein
LDWIALALSLRLAAVTTVILLVLALPLAWWLTTTRWRWRHVADALVALPMLLPPTVLGYYLLLALGPRSPVGALLLRLTGASLPFTFPGLVVGSVLYSLPFAVQPMRASFARVDQELLEAAWCLGASRLRTFSRVVLPLSRTGIVAATVLTFVHTLGEFGVVLMLGGNLPGRTRTVSVAIYDQVQSLDYAAANRTAGVLVGLSFAMLALTYRTQREGTTRWPTT